MGVIVEMRNNIKMKHIRQFCVLFVILFPLVVTGADKYIKREVRGAWLATVYCIDWPT